MDSLKSREIYFTSKDINGNERRFMAVLNDDGVEARKYGLKIEWQHFDCLIDVTAIEKVDFS